MINKINKETEKLFSVASIAGNFGATIYNQLFRLLGVNAVYLPVQVHSRIHFSRVFDSLNLIGARGINVSMPFKKEAKNHVYNAPKFFNINTLTKEDGIWAGYNTDAHGFRTALQAITPIHKLSTAWIFGTGAVATTMQQTLHQYSPACEVTALKEFPTSHVDLVINASPVGMNGSQGYSPWDDFVDKADVVFDAVVGTPKIETDLVRIAKHKGKKTISGYQMSMHGLIKQFCLHYPRFSESDVGHLVKQEVKEMGYEV